MGDLGAWLRDGAGSARGGDGGGNNAAQPPAEVPHLFLRGEPARLHDAPRRVRAEAGGGPDSRGRVQQRRRGGALGSHPVDGLLSTDVLVEPLRPDVEAGGLAIRRSRFRKRARWKSWVLSSKERGRNRRSKQNRRFVALLWCASCDFSDWKLRKREPQRRTTVLALKARLFPFCIHRFRVIAHFSTFSKSGSIGLDSI